MVLALNLLHLLPDRPAALAKIHRLLKPGGLFISSTACLADRMWFLRPVIPVMQWLGKAPYVSFVGSDDVLQEVFFNVYRYPHRFNCEREDAFRSTQAVLELAPE